MTAARQFSLPPEVEAVLAEYFKSRQLNLDNIHSLAPAIKKISDWFIEEEGRKTPWDFEQAYMAYYFPLNVVRLQGVLTESFRNFPWSSVARIIDFGSGPGTVHAALESSSLEPKPIVAVEAEPRAIRIHKSLGLNTWPCEWRERLPAEIPKGTLGVFSYSLLEEERLLSRLNEFDHLLIVTPSTRTQSRKLLEIRKKLMAEGYSSWAPCTHQQSCPLLEHSANDWCHDRIEFVAPDWFRKLESHLPFYNHTLTFSYWFASRTETPAFPARSARLIGDTLFEKGKVRQMICRGPEREFLAWLRRHGDPEPIARGSVIQLPENLVLKGNELRPPPEGS